MWCRERRWVERGSAGREEDKGQPLGMFLPVFCHTLLFFPHPTASCSVLVIVEHDKLGFEMRDFLY